MKIAVDIGSIPTRLLQVHSTYNCIIILVKRNTYHKYHDLMTKEQKFYQALQDIFIGAEIEGNGGFVNLMKIKSNYYRRVEEILRKDIEVALKEHPTFRDDLFDRLYSFFQDYFTESGSIYFHSTPVHRNIYEKIYSAERDTVLFWKTWMLYYVKTDRIFRSLELEVDGISFRFNATNIENKKNNERRRLVYSLVEVEQDRTIHINVRHSEKNSKTNSKQILKAIGACGFAISESALLRAFNIFESQSEVDFFINKDAKSFLQEQLKLRSHEYIWEGGKEWSQNRVNQLQIFKDIAFKIIDFISQFENELVKIWNKPKFALNSNYVITLDRIIDSSLITKIKAHENYLQQKNEWTQLGIEENNPKAPIDTKYFKDLEIELLSQFKNLDDSLDGWLIKSENYQALNTLLPKFNGRVQTIYIDPPFNLSTSDQFLYRTNYKNANWATLIENRLEKAKYFLTESGSMFIRCDWNGNWIVRPIVDTIFGREPINEIQIATTHKVFEGVHGYNVGTNSLFWYGKSENTSIFPQRVKRDEIYWLACHSGGERKPPERIFFGKTLLPPKGRHWTFVQRKIDEMTVGNRIRINSSKEYTDMNDDVITGMPEYKISEEKLLTSNWTDIPGYSSKTKFQTENSEILLSRVIKSTSKEKEIVMDFFLGSGTTTAVAHKLGRKWIGVEMGEHFYDVVLPRMKKVLAYEKSGISKNEKNYKGGGFFKYYELEQYEETLKNCKYSKNDMLQGPADSPYEEYVFLSDEKMLYSIELDKESNSVKVDLSKLYKNIDIAETISNSTGKSILTIQQDKVELINEAIDTLNLDYKYVKDYIWWE